MTEPNFEAAPLPEHNGELEPQPRAELMARASYVLLALSELSRYDENSKVHQLEQAYDLSGFDDPESAEQTRAGMALVRLQRTVLAGSYRNTSYDTTMEPAEATKEKDEANPYLASLRGVLTDIGLYDSVSGRPSQVVYDQAGALRGVAFAGFERPTWKPINIAKVAREAAKAGADKYGQAYEGALDHEFDKLTQLYVSRGTSSMEAVDFDELASMARKEVSDVAPMVVEVPSYDDLIADGRNVEVVNRLAEDLHALAGVERLEADDPRLG